MADDNLIIQSELRLNIQEAEAKIARIKRQLADAIESKNRSGGNVSPLLQQRIDSLLNLLKQTEAEADATRRQLTRMGTDGASSISTADKAAAGLAKTMATIFSVGMAKSFISRIMSVRGEFQQLEIAFETMLGNKEKADKLMSDAVQLAAKTPFDLQGVASGAKSLLAFGMESDKVIETLRRLGDVSAGLSLPLGRLTTIFGQTMVKGKLQTRDMLRYQQAGVPILDELAKMYNKTTNEVRAMVTAGKVGFADVEKMFKRMTDEGGRFANLMEKQSASITGRMSNIRDAIDVMFNEIGQKTEGPINSALELTGKLIENYEKVGKAIAIVTAAYGLERAALMVYIALKNRANAATAAGTAAKLKEALASETAAKAQMGLNKALLANPYVMVGAAVAALGVQLYKMFTHVSEAEKAAKKLAGASNLVDEEATKELATLERLRAQLNASEKGTKSYANAKDEIIRQFSKYDANLKEEIGNINKEADAFDRLSVSIRNAAKMRVYDSYVKSTTDALTKEVSGTVTELTERITKKFGEKDPELAGRLIAEATKFIYGDITSFDYDDLKTLNKASGGFAGVRRIFDMLSIKVMDARDAFSSLSTLEEDAKKAFGITDDMLKSPTTTPTTTPTSPQGGEKGQDMEMRRYNLEKRLNEQIRKMLREREQMELDSQQRQIDLRDDGFEKTRQQNELNFKKEMMQIKHQKEDKLRELQEEERATWMAANPEAKEYQFKGTITELPKEYADMYAQMERDAQDKRLKVQKDTYKEAIEEYGSYLQKLTVLEKEWERKIAEAPAGMKEGMERKMREELSSMNLEHFKDTINWDVVFGNLSEQSTKALKANMGKVQEYLNLNRDNLGIESIKDLESALAGMADELASRNSFSAIFDSIGDLKKLKDDMPGLVKEYKDSLREFTAARSEFNANQKSLNAQYEADSAQRIAIQQEIEELSASKEGKTEEEQASIDEQIAKKEDELAQLMTEAQYMEQLAVAAGKLDIAEQKLSRASVSLNNAQNGVVKSTTRLMAGISNLRQRIRNGTTGMAEFVSVLDSDAGEVVSKTIDLFTELGDIAMEISEELTKAGKELIEDVQDTASETAEAITKTSEATAQAISAAEAASVILLVIKAVIKVLTAVFSIISANNEASKRAAEAARQYALALEEVNDAARLENLKNAFGTDAYGQFKALNEQLHEAADSIDELSDSARNGSWWSRLTGDVTLTADMRSKWQKFWGSGWDNVVTKQLSDFFDSEGRLMGEELKVFYEQYGDYLSDTNKALVDSLIKEYERYSDAVEGSADYLENLFSDVAGNIAESMVSAFLESGDALADLTDLANDFGKAMAKSAITSMLMDKESGIFNGEAQKKISDMLIAGDVASAVDFYNQLMEQANEKAPEITEFLRQLNLGIDPDRREGESKGIAQASQDSVDELNGRATVIQGHTYSINESVKVIREQNSMLVSTTSGILAEVRGIHSDTSRMDDRLADIAAKSKRIDSNIDWIISKGVRVN